MSGFLKGTLSVILAVVIALAWPWTNLLKDVGIVDDSVRAIVIVFLTIVLVGQQTYLVVPNPASFKLVDARRRITETYLQGFLTEYYNLLLTLGVAQPFPIVRVNVMLVTKKWKGIGGIYLKSYYFSCPSGVLYNSQEWMLKWKKNGNVGWCWSHKARAIYDSVDPDLRSQGRGLTGLQQKVVGNLGSVLSEPILHDGECIGLLNMDSKENVTSTMFNYSQVYTLAAEAATVISGQFDPKGVAA